MQERNRTSKGFVKIIQGALKGRIGRFVGDFDGQRGKIAFGYENDILPYSNCKFISYQFLSDRISKQDLVERYFQIGNDLSRIDMQVHSKIKRYSADHTSLLTEFHMVRGLLNQSFHVKNMNAAQMEDNIALFSSFQDIMMCYGIASQLEINKYHVGLIAHEFIDDHSSEILTESAGRCRNFIFVISRSAIEADWLPFEYGEMKDLIDPMWQKIQFAVLESVKIPDYVEKYYCLDTENIDRYHREMSRMISTFEVP